MKTQAIEKMISQSLIIKDEKIYQNILDNVLEAFSCTTGTIHILNKQTKLLDLKASKGIPDFLMNKVDHIPIGKGIAGAAALQREAVQMCNLQTDTSGVAQSNAKHTKVAGSLAVPLLERDELKGTIGIGLTEPYDFSTEEIEHLNHVAAWLAKAV